MDAAIGAVGVTDDSDDYGHRWRKSHRSYGSGSCLEVAAPHAPGIHVRDSQAPSGPVLGFTILVWNSFLLGVRSGEPGL